MKGRVVRFNTKFQYKYIVACRVVRVTKLTGSSSDDWNY
jgi:hypothetical protein